MLNLLERKKKQLPMFMSPNEMMEEQVPAVPSSMFDNLPVIGADNGVSHAAAAEATEVDSALPETKINVEEGDSTWKKVAKIGMGALDGYLKGEDAEHRAMPLQTQMVELPPIDFNPIYANPYARQQKPVQYAKSGGFFKPGEEVIVGDGSGPEMLKVEEDGVRVIPNAKDALPQIGSPTDDPVVKEAVRRAEIFKQAQSQPEVESNTLIDSRGLPIISAPKTVETNTQTQPVAEEQPKATLPVIGAVDPIEAALKAKEAEYANLGRRTDEHKHSKWSRIAAAIEGWAKGGLFAGIEAARNPHHFEDQKVAAEKAKLLPEIGTLTQMRDAKVNAAAKVAATNDILRRPEKEAADRKARADLAVQRINLNADIRSGIAKPFIDENGKVWRQYLNADSTGKVRPNEPVVGPDGQQEWVPGEQGISWFNPRTKQTEIIKAKQAATADATIAGGDAGRVQDARKTNATKQFEAIKENINNHIQYQNNLTTQLNNVLGAEAAVLASNGTIQGINSEMQAKNTELQGLLSAPETEDDKEMKARVDRVNQLTDEMVKLNGRFTEELGKTEAGRTKAAQIKAIVDKMKAPGKVTYTPFEAVQIGAVPQGKPVPASKDPLGLFR